MRLQRKAEACHACVHADACHVAGPLDNDDAGLLTWFHFYLSQRVTSALRFHLEFELTHAVVGLPTFHWG
jgi:hypothetical protein